MTSEHHGGDRDIDNTMPAPNVVMSIGLGRLHFVQSAEVLVQEGVNLTVLQGWIPGKWMSDVAIDRLGRILGSPQLSVGMNKRRMNFLPPERNVGLAIPDFVTQALFIANRKFGLPRGLAASIGWSAFGRRSRRHLEGHNIFHVRSGAGAGGAIATAKKRGMKVIVDHSIAHPAFLEQILAPEFQSANLSFWMSPQDPFWASILKDCEDADVLLVNSDFVKHTFIERGFSPEKIAVAYLGVRGDFVSLKKDYCIGENPLNLLFTGQFGIRKGAPYLLKALETLAAEGVKFRLTVLGDASEVAELVARSPIANCVHLPGFVPQDELKAYLSTADLYIFPSLAEGCASSAMEAMAAGLPVVATAETGLPGSNGETFWSIPSRDAGAIVSAITRLSADENLRRRLGQSGAHAISNSYTWSTYGKTLLKLYQSISSDSQQNCHSAGGANA